MICIFSLGALLFGVLGAVLIMLCTFFPYITIINHIPIGVDALQLSPFSGLLLLGGAGMVIAGALIYINAKSFNQYIIAEYILAIGVITQIIGIILALVSYNDIINDIIMIKNVGGSADVLQVSPFSSNGLMLLGGGILFIAGFIIFIKTAEYFSEDKIIAYITIIGVIAQAIGIILALVAYTNITTEITSMANSIGLNNIYIIGPSYSLFLSIFGILLVIIAHYYQRKENRKFFHNEMENNATIN